MPQEPHDLLRGFKIVSNANFHYLVHTLKCIGKEILFYDRTHYIARMTRQLKGNCNVTVNFVTSRHEKKIEKKCFHRRFSFDVLLLARLLTSELTLPFYHKSSFSGGIITNLVLRETSMIVNLGGKINYNKLLT